MIGVVVNCLVGMGLKAALRMGGDTLLWDVIEGQGHSEAYL